MNLHTKHSVLAERERVPDIFSGGAPAAGIKKRLKEISLGCGVAAGVAIEHQVNRTQGSVLLYVHRNHEAY